MLVRRVLRNEYWLSYTVNNYIITQCLTYLQLVTDEIQLQWIDFDQNE